MQADLLLILVLGYLVGSLSPGYFFGRVIKHIDIRQFGNGNTGATNTYHLVGPVFGILTAIFDFLKAPLAYFLAVSGLFLLTPAINPDLAILVGLSAVVGHIKPFYLRFKGGKGVASLWGLSAVAILYTRSIFALILIVATTIYTIAISKNLKLTHPLRQILKPIVLFLPLSAIWLPKTTILTIIMIFLIIFAIFDAIRLLNPKINQYYLRLRFFAKPKERFRPAGATLLFLSALLIFWLSNKEIAILALVCFLLGDSLAPLGQRLLAIPLLRGKTLGGTVIYFLVSLTSGIFLKSLTSLSLPFSQIIFAALVTSTFDQFSFLIDDNLLVPVGTALALTVLIR